MNDLPNIPPIWTAITQWTAAAMFLSLMPKKVRGFRFWLVMLPFLAVQSGWMLLIGHMDGVPFNLGMLVAALLTYLPFVVLGQQHSMKTRAYHCARAFLVGGFCVSLGWQLYTYAETQKLMPGTPVMQTATMLVILCALFAIFYFLERRHRVISGEVEVTGSMCNMTLVITYVIYVLSSISFAPIRTPFSGSTEIDAFNARTWIYLCGVALQFANHIRLCEEQSRQELMNMQNILEMQRANFVSSKEAVELVNRKYHDLKHQIAVLKSAIGSEEKLRALDRMEDEIRAYEAENKTGNQVLDIVLTSKALTCRNQGIELTIVADGTALFFMDWIDISNLFGNMLDNAIEAVSALPQEQRLIHLSVARQRGFLCVMMENPYSEEVRVEMRGGLPVPLSKDRRFHGFGVKSIAATAEKYNGTAAFERENGWFRLRVLIPLTNQP